VGQPVVAAPLVDAARRRVYVGTTDRRILEVDLDSGDTGWRWPVGADIAHHGLLLPERILFASHDAVLYAVRPGGNLDWRAPLPSRPLSGPVLVASHVMLACLENEIVAVSAQDGRRTGTLRTPAEIRTAPIVVGERIVLGLRDRSVVAYLPAGAPSSPRAGPTDEPATFEPAPKRP
jgi:outer membrane protein assembly factor BamB